MSDETTIPATYDEALAAIQANLPDIAKTRTAEVEMKSGRKYTYDYADLPAVSRIILPMLGKVGLSWSTKTTLVDGRFMLVYRLKHVSGEEDGGMWPLPMPGQVSPQDVGGAITYARRYALCCMTGVAPEGEDDDAAAASQGTRRGQRAAKGRAKPDESQQTMQRARPQSGPPLPGEAGYERPPVTDADRAQWRAEWQVRFDTAADVAALESLGRSVNSAVRGGLADEAVRDELRGLLRQRAASFATPGEPAPPDDAGVSPEEIAAYQAQGGAA
ncbi:ERF family protein [Parafrankia sp. FMc6]|uniref:ERF family protein n=1 Tax=Parafrankia soli TaxID=2599596 RepID=UPI0034D7A7A4